MDHVLLEDGLNLSPTLGPLYWGTLLFISLMFTVFVAYVFPGFLLSLV